MKFWFGKKGAEPSNDSCDVLTFGERSPEIGATLSSSILITPQQGGSGPVAGGSAPQPKSLFKEPKAEVKPPVAAGLGSEVPAPVNRVEPFRQAAAPVESRREPAAPVVSIGKGAPVSLQAPVNRVQVGMSGLGAFASADGAKGPRPVMTPVRMAAQTAPVRLQPMTAAPAAAQAAPARSAPSFGLRPKEGSAGGPVPLASPGPKPLVPAAAPSAPAQPAPTPLAPKAAPAAGSAQAGAPENGGTDRDADGVVRPKTDQRALYYQLMNGMYDAVLILDDQGHIVDCNTRVTDMLGYTREETWDIPIEKIITGMSSQMFDHLKRNLAENHHILIDARCFRQDGTSFAGEVGVSTLSLTRGSNIVFAVRNVDRRKIAMDEMRKGQSALEIALAPAFVCDLDGFFLVVNQAMLDAFGIPDEAQAKTVRFIDLLPDAARYFLRASCGEKLRETVRVPTPNGIPVKIELALKPVQSGQTVTAVAGSILQS